MNPLLASQQPGFLALAPDPEEQRILTRALAVADPALAAQVRAQKFAPSVLRMALGEPNGPTPSGPGPVPQAPTPSAPPRATTPSPRLAPAPSGVNAGPMQNSGPAPQNPALAGIQQRRMQLDQELAALNQTPDYTQLASQMAQRRQAGEEDIRRAMLAGMGPQSLRPLQQHFMKQGMDALDPMRIEGGMITSDGQVMLDPGFQHTRKMDLIRQRLVQLDQMELRAFDMQEKNAIARERNEIMQMVARMRWAGKGAGSEAANNFGGPSVHVANDAQGNAVYRHTKSGQLFYYDQGGQAQPYSGETFSKAPLPSSIAQKLSQYEGQLQDLSALRESWRPEFAAAYPGTGGMEIFAGKYLPGGSSDMANWWQNYQRWANLVRNSLFGSALTAHEKAAFDAANIGPNQKNDLIVTNLDQQIKAAHDAYTKLARHYRRSSDSSMIGPRPDAPAPGNTSVLPRATGAQQPQTGVQLPSQQAIEAELRRRGVMQ